MKPEWLKKQSERFEALKLSERFRTMALDVYLNECGLLDQVLDGIESLPYILACKDRVINSMCEYKMALIAKSVHVAGRCCYRAKKIQLHRELLRPGREEDRNNTLLHEVAHLITKVCEYGTARAHGREWKFIARAIGDDGNRCHSYSYFTDMQVSNAKHKYVCIDCGHEYFTMRKLVRLPKRFHTPCRFKENSGRLKHIQLR